MTNTPWLSPEEQRTWRAFVGVSRAVHESLDRQLQHDFDMPHAYYMILAMLSEAPRQLRTMTDLADCTGFSPSRLSHAVSKLEQRGWVARERHPACGRTNVAQLTDAGRTALRAAAPGHVAQVRAVLFDKLSQDEQEQLGRLLHRILGDAARPDHPKSADDCAVPVDADQN